VLPLDTPLVASQAFPMLEYVDAVRENRTGVTRYNQGIDADALNKTASGISQIMGAAQQRLELIARVFAETGIKDLFRKVLELVCKRQNAPRILRLRNKWVAMDPREWDAGMDMSINVGLGTGNKDQMLAHLQTLLSIQQKAIELQGGADGPIVTLPNVYSTLAKLVENAGLKSVDAFFTDPSQAAAMGAPASPPPEPTPPDPTLLAVQQQAAIEAARLELDRRRLEADIALDRAKLEADIMLKREALAVKAGGSCAKCAGQAAAGAHAH
jgi:hypothetical protein